MWLVAFVRFSCRSVETIGAISGDSEKETDSDADTQSDFETWELDDTDSDEFDDDDSDDIGDINDKLICINRSTVRNDLVSIGDNKVIENKAAAQLQQNSLVGACKSKYILVEQQQLRLLFHTHCPKCGRATRLATRVSSVPANWIHFTASNTVHLPICRKLVRP